MPSQPLTASLPDPDGGAPCHVVAILPTTDDGGILAIREWQAHVDAGRIGNIVASSPDRLASEAQVREMERIFGVRRGGIW